MLWLTLASCTVDAPTWQYGADLSDLTVAPIAWEEGVYPDTSVLVDPGNPFAAGIDDVVKWEILTSDCAPGFYAFATALAQRPTGENQYYTAFCLQSLYDTARLAPDDTYWGWSAAVRGYQAVLDHFPDAVTYDASGTIAWPLAPLAFDGIVSLGATPVGWEAIETTDGDVLVVPTGGPP